MNYRQSRVFDSLRRAASCCVAHTPTPTPPGWTEQLQQLHEAIDATVAHAVGQLGHGNTAEGVTTLRTALIAALYDEHLVPLRQIARGFQCRVPGIKYLFIVPPRDVPVNTLLASARAMAEHAARYSALFATYLGRDFGARLDAAITAVDVATMDRHTHRRCRNEATTGLRETLTLGRQAIQFLDVMIRAGFRHDVSTLTEWTRAIRIGRRRSSSGTATQVVEADIAMTELTAVVTGAAAQAEPAAAGPTAPEVTDHGAPAGDDISTPFHAGRRRFVPARPDGAITWLWRQWHDAGARRVG